MLGDLTAKTGDFCIRDIPAVLQNDEQNASLLSKILLIYPIKFHIVLLSLFVILSLK